MFYYNSPFSYFEKISIRRQIWQNILIQKLTIYEHHSCNLVNNTASITLAAFPSKQRVSFYIHVHWSCTHQEIIINFIESVQDRRSGLK